jgi:hypothetical protein
MKLSRIAFASLLAAALLGGSLVTHAADKTYQVTGTVVSVTDSTVTVKKDTENWTLARDKATKGGGDLKVGAKVTIYYKMVATEVEVKESKKK